MSDLESDTAETLKNMILENWIRFDVCFKNNLVG